MLNYPLTLSFKLLALNPQVRITDSTGQLARYVKQKALALKEDIKVFADEAQQQPLFHMKANKIIDFSAQYNITTPAGQAVGAVKRQGMRSMWKATYLILDASGAEVGAITEENPWLRLLDALLSEVPFLNTLVNPAYLVNLRGQTVLYLKKQPAIMEGRFTLDKRGDFSQTDEDLLMCSIIMTMMLERMRG
jgi:uncharacterized protein YxjI